MSDENFIIEEAAECARCEYCNTELLLWPGSSYSDLDAVRKRCFICRFCDKASPLDVFTGEYAAYLRSSIWKAKREAALERADNRCQVCNSDLLLQVHHRKYPKELGTEDPMDLTVLCRRCHDLFHNVR
jgi:5-methylcytosine-specific restriction endonuclease McrA